jgi:hypothetical protein
MAKNLPLSIETVPISPIYIAESSGCAGPTRGAKKLMKERMERSPKIVEK